MPDETRTIQVKSTMFLRREGDRVAFGSQDDDGEILHMSLFTADQAIYWATELINQGVQLRDEIRRADA